MLLLVDIRDRPHMADHLSWNLGVEKIRIWNLPVHLWRWIEKTTQAWCHFVFLLIDGKNLRQWVTFMCSLYLVNAAHIFGKVLHRTSIAREQARVTCGPMMIFISLDLLIAILILINPFLWRGLVELFWWIRWFFTVVMILSEIFLRLFMKRVWKEKVIKILSLRNQTCNLVSILLFLGCLIVNLILHFSQLLIDFCENLGILFILFSVDTDRYHILI